MIVVVPIKTSSTNSKLRQHWAKSARQAKLEREAVAWSLATRTLPAPPVHVTLVRVGPRLLDDDNVRGALKAVRDEVAAQLGVDDADPLVMWRYEQKKGAEYGVEIMIERACDRR